LIPAVFGRWHPKKSPHISSPPLPFRKSRIDELRAIAGNYILAGHFFPTIGVLRGFYAISRIPLAGWVVFGESVDIWVWVSSAGRPV
jgi:hypothetical protein